MCLPHRRIARGVGAAPIEAVLLGLQFLTGLEVSHLFGVKHAHGNAKLNKRIAHEGISPVLHNTGGIKGAQPWPTDVRRFVELRELHSRVAEPAILYRIRST